MDTNRSTLDVLGVPTRRAIMERLRDGPQTVGEIAAGLPITRPAVSQHLKVMKAAGLVTSHRSGTRQIYAMNPAGLTELRAYVESFWTAALSDFQAAALAAAKTRTPSTSRRKRR